MKLVIDMNLSPDWVAALRERGWAAEHWSRIGDPKAPDPDILAWAAAHDRVLFTHDLHFGALLAASGGTCPSVIQLRTQDVTPSVMLETVCAVLEQQRDHLERGALISVDPARARVRLLPLE